MICQELWPSAIEMGGEPLSFTIDDIVDAWKLPDCPEPVCADPTDTNGSEVEHARETNHSPQPKFHALCAPVVNGETPDGQTHTAGERGKDSIPTGSGSRSGVVASAKQLSFQTNPRPGPEHSVDPMLQLLPVAGTSSPGVALQPPAQQLGVQSMISEASVDDAAHTAMEIETHAIMLAEDSINDPVQQTSAFQEVERGTTSAAEALICRTQVANSDCLADAAAAQCARTHSRLQCENMQRVNGGPPCHLVQEAAVPSTGCERVDSPRRDAETWNAGSQQLGILGDQVHIPEAHGLPSPGPPDMDTGLSMQEKHTSAPILEAEDVSLAQSISVAGDSVAELAANMNASQPESQQGGVGSKPTVPLRRPVLNFAKTGRRSEACVPAPPPGPLGPEPSWPEENVVSERPVSDTLGPRINAPKDVTLDCQNDIEDAADDVEDFVNALMHVDSMNGASNGGTTLAAKTNRTPALGHHRPANTTRQGPRLHLVSSTAAAHSNPQISKSGAPSDDQPGSCVVRPHLSSM